MRLLVIGKFGTEVSQACKIATDKGAKIINAENIEQGLQKLLSGDGVEAVLIDVEQDIARFVIETMREHITTPIIAYGINADSKKAALSIKAGAQEYLPLPPEEELIAAILESISDEKLEMISSSEVMKKVVELAEKVSPSDASVLITGESGTGKEVMARYIHSKSNRKNEKFVSVNCAAIPENLLESELFGHEKGAFTGALNRRIGKFEESSNGTLLLDEISEMDLRLQAKLLRALQEKEIDRVGGSTPVKVNLRILATSNRDLKKEVKEGRFREDLYFRLNVIQLQLPPLRERRDDIKAFAAYFSGKFAEQNSLAKPKIADDAMRALEAYEWQGNVRELENTMHRAVLLSNKGVIDKNCLMLEGIENSNENTNGSELKTLVGRTVSDVEKELILNTLGSVSGNRSKAATILGISLRTLHNKLKEYEASQQVA
ncbi:MAG TPA: sigma-54-dependent Fis family transcriptional regulator [Alphaproteobacteria bacterium]|nr:sigma-54-dependent Fis family transcriptional regulator [Alphaproteobacteria bacterium]